MPAAGVAWLAVFAILLRLALPTATAPAHDIDLTAAFGEHALCLAGAATEKPAQAPGGSPEQPADHADHDDLGCCLWHATATGFVLPETAAVAPAVYEIRLAAAGATAITTTSRVTGPAQARAPPQAA